MYEPKDFTGTIIQQLCQMRDVELSSENKERLKDIEKTINNSDIVK